MEFPRFQPTPICCENATAPMPEDDELDELELEELELDELELELDELELEEDELDEDELELDELLLVQLETTPPSPHWSSQVVAPIQLWLFSQPQPLLWFWHRGRISPYQLHISLQFPPEVEEELLELDEELLELELLELELLELELLEDELDDEELLELELELPPPVAVQLKIVAVGFPPAP